MRLLPVVQRELGAASRRWSTFLIRVGVGLLALVLAVPGLLYGSMTGGSGGTGQGVFTLLSHYIFVVGLAGGVLITADCLSGEKRAGTLGLLFLTDLRGYDVVFGKFAALGLYSIYAMLAVVPALALPLLSGGVTGGEFWRVALALLNLLFVSLSVGMTVSAASREAARSFFLTVAIMLVLVAALPLGVQVGQALGVPRWVSHLGWINPGHAFTVGRTGGSGVGMGEYWVSLGLSHSLGWILLIVAGWIVRNSWQDKGVEVREPTLLRRLLGERVARVFRCTRSPALLDRYPILWLMGERPVLRILLWVIAGAWCVCVVAACVILGPERLVWGVFWPSAAILLVFCIALVEHSCRFWVEARQSGSLETLLVVPLRDREILSSHWASIRHHFLWPLLVVLCAATVPAWAVVLSDGLQGRLDGGQLFERLFTYAFMASMIGWFLATFIAIGYTGMWFALKLRRPHFATGLTVLCVLLLPVVLCHMGIGITLLFIFLPMSLLQSNLRGLILQRYLPGVPAGDRIRA